MQLAKHLNPIQETRSGCPVTSKYGRTPPNKHGSVCRHQQAGRDDPQYSSDVCQDVT